MTVSMTLEELAGEYAVCRLSPDLPIPSWPTGKLTSITSTDEELSITCAAPCVPDWVQAERDWVALKVAGPLDFSMVGVLAALATPLADAGVSIFVVSTFDTDYLMVKQEARRRAFATLKRAGHSIRPTNQPEETTA